MTTSFASQSGDNASRELRDFWQKSYRDHMIFFLNSPRQFLINFPPLFSPQRGWLVDEFLNNLERLDPSFFSEANALGDQLSRPEGIRLLVDLTEERYNILTTIREPDALRWLGIE